MRTGTPASPPPPRSADSGSARPKRRKYWPWLGAGLLIALVIAGLWPKALPVEIAAVRRGDVIVTVNEEGMTRVKNRYVVSSPVAGQLQRIDWKPGAVVEAGKTVLAVLETRGADLLDARAQAEAEARGRAAEAGQKLSEAQLARAQAAATLAKRDLERFRALAERKAISQQDFDTAAMRATTSDQEVRAAEFAYQVSEFELQQAKALLLRGQDPEARAAPPLLITSPVNGRVLRVFEESSRVVPGGLPLVEVGDPTDLELRIEVLSRDAVGIRPGARVLVEQWGGSRSLEARVRVVEPSAFTKISALGVEEQRVYVVADLLDGVDQRLTLGDNYRIEARVVVSSGENVLKVPAGALFQRGGTWYTFVVERGRTRLRSVQTGRTNGMDTEIVDGLKEGDQVVVYPGDKVADGTRVDQIMVSPR